MRTDTLLRYALTLLVIVLGSLLPIEARDATPAELRRFQGRYKMVTKLLTYSLKDNAFITDRIRYVEKIKFRGGDDTVYIPGGYYYHEPTRISTRPRRIFVGGYIIGELLIEEESSSTIHRISGNYRISIRKIGNGRRPTYRLKAKQMVRLPTVGYIRARTKGKKK